MRIIYPLAPNPVVGTASVDPAFDHCPRVFPILEDMVLANGPTSEFPTDLEILKNGLSFRTLKKLVEVLHNVLICPSESQLPLG